MEKMDIEKEHITTREGLHDLMISYNFMAEKQIDKTKLSKLIYEFIDGVYNCNNNDSPFDYEISKYVQHYLWPILFFKYKDDNYIYWVCDNNKSDEANYMNKIEFLECLLDNYNELDADQLIDILSSAKVDLNFIKKSESYTTTTLKQQYENYDYVKILKYNHNIGYFDVSLCKDFLKLSDNNLEDFSLTVDEKICLCFIILYGLKNTFFYTSKLYKNSLHDYYNDINNLNVWVNFIEENKDNISKDRIFSKEYECGISLKDLVKQFSVVQEHKVYYVIRRYILSNYLKEPIQMIYFDYLINNMRYEDARKYLNENDIYLYSYLERLLISEVDKDEILSLLINGIINDYKIIKNDTTECEATLNDLLSDKEYKNRYVIPVLRFIINYLYLLKSENKEKQVDCLYSFLKIFDKGFGIEDFFIKFNYELLFSELNKINKADENADIENIDIVINEISEKIEKANLIDKQDIEKVEKMYKHINFNNLNPKVKNYIATGDTIMIVFNDSNNVNFDYSSAVIEWSKAVELEVWEKLTKPVKEDAKKICNQIDPYKYKKRNKDKRDFKPEELTNFKFKSNIGTFDAIDIRYMKDGRTMRKYLYDNYYFKYDDLDENTYDDLINNILLVYDPRNKSAHKDDSIQLKDAKECQTVVVAANKILEVLSRIKCKNIIA